MRIAKSSEGGQRRHCSSGVLYRVGSGSSRHVLCVLALAVSDLWITGKVRGLCAPLAQIL